jgi:hypothetical protein
VRDRNLWWASLPIVALFTALSLVSIHHHLGFAIACFMGLRHFIVDRDGGCIFPGCERPPSFTEVHHGQF